MTFQGAIKNPEMESKCEILVSYWSIVAILDEGGKGGGGGRRREKEEEEEEEESIDKVAVNKRR